MNSEPHISDQYQSHGSNDESQSQQQKNSPQSKKSSCNSLSLLSESQNAPYQSEVKKMGRRPLQRGISNVSKRSEKQKLMKGDSSEKWEAIVKMDAGLLCNLPEVNLAKDTKNLNNVNMAEISEMRDEEEKKESSSSLLSEEQYGDSKNQRQQNNGLYRQHHDGERHSYANFNSNRVIVQPQQNLLIPPILKSVQQNSENDSSQFNLIGQSHELDISNPSEKGPFKMVMAKLSQYSVIPQSHTLGDSAPSLFQQEYHVRLQSDPVPKTPDIDQTLQKAGVYDALKHYQQIASVQIEQMYQFNNINGEDPDSIEEGKVNMLYQPQKKQQGKGLFQVARRFRGNIVFEQQD